MGSLQTGREPPAAARRPEHKCMVQQSIVGAAEVMTDRQEVTPEQQALGYLQGCSAASSVRAGCRSGCWACVKLLPLTPVTAQRG